MWRLIPQGKGCQSVVARISHFPCAVTLRWWLTTVCRRVDTPAPAAESAAGAREPCRRLPAVRAVPAGAAPPGGRGTSQFPRRGSLHGVCLVNLGRYADAEALYARLLPAQRRVQ